MTETTEMKELKKSNPAIALTIDPTDRNSFKGALRIFALDSIGP